MYKYMFMYMFDEVFVFACSSNFKIFTTGGGKRDNTTGGGSSGQGAQPPTTQIATVCQEISCAALFSTSLSNWLSKGRDGQGN